MKNLFYVLLAVLVINTSCGKEEDQVMAENSPTTAGASKSGDETDTGDSNEETDNSSDDENDSSSDARLEIYQKIYAATDLH